MDDLAIIGVGMHPWGKWGRNFAEYGTFAAREALAEQRGVDAEGAGGELRRVLPRPAQVPRCRNHGLCFPS